MPQTHELLTKITLPLASVAAIAGTLAFDAAFLKPDAHNEISLEAGDDRTQQLGNIAASNCLAAEFTSCPKNPLDQLSAASTTTSPTTISYERTVSAEVSRSKSTTTLVTPPSLPPEISVTDNTITGLDNATPEERAYLFCIAQKESGGDPSEYNGAGPYYGKYQFLQNTWDGFVGTIGLGDLAGVDIRQVPERVQDYVAWRFLRASRKGEWGPNGRCVHFLLQAA